LLNAPIGSSQRLASELEGISILGQSTGEVTAVLVFVNDLEETSRFVPEDICALTRDGLLWVAYPKGASKIKTDVIRDKLWVAVEQTGWRPVRQVALDEIWAASRFRPAELIGK
jgi:hypothetical protein